VCAPQGYIPYLRPPPQRTHVPSDTPTITPPDAHRRPDGGFRNPWPNGELHGFGDFLKWRLGDRRKHPAAPSPPRDSLPTKTPQIVHPRARAGYRSVTWIGHSTTLLQLGALNILTDPVWSERASPLQWIGPRRLMAPGLDFDALPEIDVVLLSHNHYDHLDRNTVRRIAARFPRASWFCPLRVGSLLRSFGVQHLVERDWWQTVETPMLTATATPAQHFSARGLGDRNDTLWCGWTIRTPNANVYFAGDTALHPEFAAIGERLGPFDLVMLPIGAYDPRWFMRAVHMDPDDAIAAYRALSTSTGAFPLCVPIHWGTFRLTDEAVGEPPVRFAQGWRDAGLPADANWTFAHGETRQF
jgi:N-acyl-phosphatidylethanolamine-hydrolysing phospholipase D